MHDDECYVALYFTLLSIQSFSRPLIFSPPFSTTRIDFTP